MREHESVLLELQPGFLEIVDAEQLSGAVECAAQIASYARDLDKQRLQVTKGARDTVAGINKMFNEKINSLREKADEVVGAIQYYFRENKLSRAEGALGSTASMRDRFTWRVVDIDKVPDDLFVKPEDRLQKKRLHNLCQKQKVNEDGEFLFEVPGIEFMPIAQLTLRTKDDVE